MASAPPSPLYPDVPQAPGVPPVFRDDRNASTAAQETRALVKDGLSAAKPPWGLYFPKGGLALECDSVVALEPGREARISDYPIEGGGFANYNKVMTPGITRVTVTKGGSPSVREAFLGTLDQLLESTDLFSVVAPDSAYLKRNLVRYDMRRNAEAGANLLSIDLTCQEVRETAEIRYSDTKAPSGAEPVNAGPVQSKPVPAGQLPAAAPASMVPAVRDIPAIPPTATQIERAATVSSLIQAGATLPDLVAKNVQFLSVPLLVTPSQILSTVLGGQNVRLAISQNAFGLFTDIFVNGSLVLGGVLSEAGNPLVRSAYLGFLGDLYFHDSQGDGAGKPDFSELGTRYSLLYAGA